MKTGLRKIIRQYRAKPQYETPLCHILINIRTWGDPYWINCRLKKVLLDKQLHREYMIKQQVTEQYEWVCHHPHINRPELGRKTYFQEGRYYDHDPSIAARFGDLPF